MRQDRRSRPRLDTVDRFRSAVAEIVPLTVLDAPENDEQRAFANEIAAIMAVENRFSGKQLLRLERMLRALRGLLHSN